MTQIMKKDPNTEDEFLLDGQPEQHIPFDLEQEAQPESSAEPVQDSLVLPEHNAEQPEATPQSEIPGMAKPVHMVTMVDAQQNTHLLPFQNAPTLLESLESQGAHVHYQCREGYCGSCRTKLVKGSVHYTDEPLAWVADDEILPCCCIPKEAITIQID